MRHEGFRRGVNAVTYLLLSRYQLRGQARAAESRGKKIGIVKQPSDFSMRSPLRTGGQTAPSLSGGEIHRERRHPCL